MTRDLSLGIVPVEAFDSGTSMLVTEGKSDDGAGFLHEDLVTLCIQGDTHMMCC